MRVKHFDVYAARRRPPADDKIRAGLRERRKVDVRLAGLPHVGHRRAVEHERLNPVAEIEVALDDSARRVALSSIDWEHYDRGRHLDRTLRFRSSWSSILCVHRRSQ